MFSAFFNTDTAEIISESSTLTNNNNSTGTPNNKKRKIDEFKEKDKNLKLKEAESRNILVIGATRSGKTTLMKLLTDPSYINEKRKTLFSETIEARLNNFVTENNSTNYILNIIDTPGLFEITAKTEKARTNEEITSVIMDCLRNEITKINKIFFVFSKELGLSAANVETINLFLEKYPIFALKCTLIVTHCENEETNDLLALEEELRKSGITGIPEMNILFSGCIENRNNVEERSKELEEQYKRVRDFRNLILNDIFKSDNPLKIDALTKYDSYKQEFENLTRRLKQDIPNLISENPPYNDYYYNRWREILKSLLRLKDNPLFMASKIESSNISTLLKLIERQCDKDDKLKKLCYSILDIKF